MSWNKGLGLRMTSNTLRIDPNDSSPVTEYRVENGRVEHRTLPKAAQGSATSAEQWQRLTRDQLTSHVIANTVLAHWLSRKFGLHALIRACNKSSSPLSKGTTDSQPFGRAIVVGEFSPLIAQGDTAAQPSFAGPRSPEGGYE